MMMKRAGFIIPGSIVGSRGPPALGGRGIRALTMGVVSRHGDRQGAARPPTVRISRGLGRPLASNTGASSPVPASAAPAGACALAHSTLYLYLRVRVGGGVCSLCRLCCCAVSMG